MQRCIGSDFVSRAEIPHRQHVRIADRAIVGQAQHAELDRIERIDATWSPRRPLVLASPFELLGLPQKAFLQERNNRVAVDQPVEPGQMHFLFHGGQQAIA